MSLGDSHIKQKKQCKDAGCCLVLGRRGCQAGATGLPQTRGRAEVLHPSLPDTSFSHLGPEGRQGLLRCAAGSFEILPEAWGWKPPQQFPEELTPQPTPSSSLGSEEELSERGLYPSAPTLTSTCLVTSGLLGDSGFRLQADLGGALWLLL